MYLRFRKTLKDILFRFKKRSIGLAKYLQDYKTITFSVLYLLCTATLIPFLRNIKPWNTIGLVSLCALVFLCYLMKSIIRKRQIEIMTVGEKVKTCLGGVGTIFELLSFLFVTVLIACVRVMPVLNHQMRMEERAASFTNGSTNLKGFIYEEPAEKHNNQQVVFKLLEDIRTDLGVVNADDTFLLVKTSSFYKLHLGQLCNFRGTLEVPENFQDFDYRGYLRDRKIFFLMNNPVLECESISKNREGSILRNWLVDSKNKMIAVIDKLLNEPQSSLLAGIVFGQKRLLSKAFDEGTRVAGLSHIVAASGYNITILVIVTERIFFFLPKKLRVVVGLIVIWLFAMLSGMSTSIVRACIMGSISLLAIIFGRSNVVHVAIPLTSVIFVVINPLIVFDAGFLLSVSAVLGLTYILPILIGFKDMITKRFRFIENNILPTLSCTLGTIPISVLTFKTISVWAVASNTVILPIIETTMFLGISGIVLWNIFKPFSYILFTVVNMQLKYFESITNLIHTLNWGQIEFSNSVAKGVSLSFLFLIILMAIYFYPIENEQYNYYLKTDT